MSTKDNVSRCKVPINQFCSGQDKKRCQLKSGHNKYEGEVVEMCKECRKAMNGAFRILKK